MSKWNDTLEVKQKLRLEWKIERDLREEEHRQPVDKREADMQQQYRELTIKRADHLLFKRNERVQYLWSQQMYSSIVEEREGQMEEKRIRGTRRIQEEELWHRDTMLQMEKTTEKEEEEQEQKKCRAKEIAKILKVQKREVETFRKQAKQRQRQDGAQLLQQIAFEDMQDAQKEFLDKLERKKKQRESVEKMERDAKHALHVQTKQEKMETEQRRGINDERDQMASSRIALGKRHFDEKQKLRQNIINRSCGRAGEQERRRAGEQERKRG